MITKKQFNLIFPNCSDSESWISAMSELFPKYEINTPERISAFIAQCGHESGGFRVFEENLNYSAKGLQLVFGKYFKNKNILEYARNPEKIANLVYANRMGNGNPETGDGWKYRGRGPIQITGKYNYFQFSYDMGIDISNPDILCKDIKISLLSAIWFWNKHNLNIYADSRNLIQMTKIINGGDKGLKSRIEYFDKILVLLNEAKFEILKVGSTGEDVIMIQRILGIKNPDGIFGNYTKGLLKIWQRDNGLVPDGVVGEKTFKKMLQTIEYK